MQEDKKLKSFLVLQSFCPLFLLVLFKHIGHFGLIIRFFAGLFHGDFSVLGKMAKSAAFGDVVLSFFSIIWLISTVIVAIGFRNFQYSSFASHGETIIIGSEKKDSGTTFLLTFILPLLLDDVSTLRGFIVFCALVTMVIYLLIQSDLFYQNPVLVALHYKTYEFQFRAPYEDVEKDKVYIGVTKGSLPYDGAVIKRKYIADDVFLVYND